jgi:nitroimidazol reductase NimA-like FMN-containing flavoprotein (pyridoxamine 5'-phosphate oxidase superfamily)
MLAMTDPKEQLQALFQTQMLAVLCTQNKGWPYGSLVAFASTDDLREIVFATPRTTRKYDNIDTDKRVALLIDNRSNKVEDFHQATAATAIGEIQEITAAKADPYVSLYLEKHPHLQDFVQAPTCALLRVKVEKYYIVNRFQHVIELHLTEQT